MTTREAIVIRAPLRLSENFIDTPYFCGVGSYQAAAVLRACGWSVRVIDGLAAPEADLVREGENVWLGESRERFLGRIGSLDADLVVLHADAYLLQPPGRSWLAEILAGIGIPDSACLALAEMVTGGMHYFEADPKPWLLEPGRLDVYLRYEGERLLASLARDLEEGLRPDREIREERLSFDLDALPAPAFDLLDSEEYFSFLSRVWENPWRPGPFPVRPERTLPLVTSRGCPYGCVFCSSTPGLEGAEARKFRPISWLRVDGWIRGWVRDMNLERIAILDDVANLDKRRFESLLTTLEKNNLRVEFPNGLRADRIEQEHVERLSRLTSELKISLESSCARVQNEVIGKRLDPAAVDRVARWCQQAGLPLWVHVMIGLPGERREEIIDTLKTVIDLHDRTGAMPLLQYATPLPGTELARICEQDGLLAVEGGDLMAGFQHEPAIRTKEFDPGFLTDAAGAFRRRVEASAGRKVIINLTYKCNNHCVFCAVGDRPRRHANRSEIDHALRFYGMQGYRLLDIDGGEPTLHPDLFRIVETGHREGFERITLITNGRMLSYGDYTRKLFLAGVDEILVSLHAPDKELQARITGVEESFDQTVSGIRHALGAAAEPGQIAVNTTVTAENLSAIGRLGRLLAGLGVKRWNLQLVTPFGRAREGQVPPKDALRPVLYGLLADPPGGMHIQVINCPPCLIPGYEDYAAIDFGKASRDMVFVGARGENLQAFLAHRRRQGPECRVCAWSPVCPGHYVFEDEA